MYLNEKAWEIQQDDHYVIHRALKNFMQIYSILAGEFEYSPLYCSLVLGFCTGGYRNLFKIFRLSSGKVAVRSGYRIQKIVPFFLGKAYSLSAGRRM
jgi:hypothetical protein